MHEVFMYIGDRIGYIDKYAGARTLDNRNDNFVVKLRLSLKLRAGPRTLSVLYFSIEKGCWPLLSSHPKPMNVLYPIAIYVYLSVLSSGQCRTVLVEYRYRILSDPSR